jgi:hypothetical protein
VSARPRGKARAPIDDGLRAESSLRRHLGSGLTRLTNSDREHVARDIRPDFGDSLALDEATRDEHPSDPRWDYLLGHTVSDAIVALEVHPATIGEVSRVIRKKHTAIATLGAHLRSGVRVRRWFWAASGKVAFVPFEKARLALDRAAIVFVGSTLTAKHLADLG